MEDPLPFLTMHCERGEPDHPQSPSKIPWPPRERNHLRRWQRATRPAVGENDRSRSEAPLPLVRNTGDLPGSLRNKAGTGCFPRMEGPPSGFRNPLETHPTPGDARPTAIAAAMPVSISVANPKIAMSMTTKMMSEISPMNRVRHLSVIIECVPRMRKGLLPQVIF